MPDQAHQALVDHLQAVAPWGVQVTVDLEAEGAPFRAAVDGPAYEAIASAMEDAYGTPMTTLGQGGSIPLCNVFAETYPDAELIMIGVEEPAALIHAPNESVAPSEIRVNGPCRGALHAAVRHRKGRLAAVSEPVGSGPSLLWSRPHHDECRRCWERVRNGCRGCG